MTDFSMPLVDTHCHLNMAVFEDDLGSVIERANKAGISNFLVPGTNLETSRSAIGLAKKYPGVYAAVGFHPHDANKWNPAGHAELKRLAQQPEVVAVGEIGLDYYRNLSDPIIQRTVFLNQLDLAVDLGVPVVVHNRDATVDLLSILSDWAPGLPTALRDRAGVLHAFSANVEAASNAIEKGFYIGIAGPITFRSADDLRNLVGKLPWERIVTETDAPYLTPDPHRGKRNEPGNVQFVTAAIAKTRQVEFELAKEQTAENARVLFQWNHEISDSHIL